MDKNIGGYILSGVSWLGVGLSMQEGLQLVGAWLAVISASVSLLSILISFIIKIVTKVKKAYNDKHLTAEEKDDIKNTLFEGVNDIKSGIDTMQNAINNTKEGK